MYNVLTKYSRLLLLACSSYVYLLSIFNTEKLNSVIADLCSSAKRHSWVENWLLLKLQNSRDLTPVILLIVSKFPNKDTSTLQIIRRGRLH